MIRPSLASSEMWEGAYVRPCRSQSGRSPAFGPPICFRIYDSGFTFWVLEFGIWGLGFVVWGLGFGVWGLWFGV